MSPVTSDSLRAVQHQGEDGRTGHPAAAPARKSGGPRWGLLVTGLVAVGLGIAAWHYLAPDVRRYIRISSM